MQTIYVVIAQVEDEYEYPKIVGVRSNLIKAQKLVEATEQDGLDVYIEEWPLDG